MLRRYLPTALLLLAVIAVWHVVASIPSVDDLTLASPAETARALDEDSALLLDNALVTLAEALIGLAVAIVVGAAVAVAMHLAPWLRDAAYPLLIATQAVPIVVFAPLLILAFDYGMEPKVAIVAIVCFFPVTLTLIDGLRSVEPDLLKLMRSMGAGRLATLWKVELPWSLPFLFSGIKIAASIAVVGAVFGEWAGADEGLGRLVLLGINQLETPRVYAGVVLLTAMSLFLFVSAVLAERVAVPWERRS